MTARERAKDVFDSDEILWLGPDRVRIEERIKQAIIAAVEEKGEACARIADAEAARHLSNAALIGNTNLHAKDIANASAAVARDLAQQIRARVMHKLKGKK